MFTAAGKSAAASSAVYIEDVFSTYLYTGNGTTQTITNGIDLSGKGGLVWGKSRSNAYDNFLADSVRGSSKLLYSNNTYAQQTDANVFSSFNSNGFSLGIGGAVSSNTNGATYASWAFRKQPKFFDVVTYTGNGTAGRTIAHNLGSVPGCVITKKTNSTSNWAVYHRGITSSENGAILLNSSDAWVSSSAVWNNTAPTSTNFTVGTADATNINGETYVAYLFAHDAGGFGASGTDNVISCGSFTTSAGGTATVTLGYEPQFLLVKTSAVTGSWQMIDIMRGMPVGSACRDLAANSSAAEGTGYTYSPTATGFTFATEASRTYIYIAIRRGPMKTPTSGTSVFTPNVSTTTDITGETFTVGFPPDSVWPCRRNASSKFDYDRLRGENYLVFNTSGAENNLAGIPFDQQNSFKPTYNFYQGSPGVVLYSFGRAPGFFDVVCYTGTTADNTQTHNLSAVPELIIIKRRDAAQSWAVFNSFTSTQLTRSFLNFDSPATTYLYTDNVGVKQQPTSTQFVLNGANTFVNVNAGTYVAYLFATVAGVSKVGSYTGTGALQTINCGFAAGARFVLIKRTDTTGDWWVYDSARGISSGNDPYLFLNSTAAEVTNTNYVDTASTGFQVTAAAPAGLNANGGTYIFLAIA